MELSPSICLVYSSVLMVMSSNGNIFHVHNDIIKWKHFPRYWPFVRGIHQSPVNSPHKGQWRGALMFSLICVWINGLVNNGEAGDLRCYRAHYDVTVMYWPFVQWIHRSPVNSLHKGQWCGALMFSLICTWINSGVNNCEAGDLRCHCDHYDVTVITSHGHCNTITINADSFQINFAKQKQSSYELFVHQTEETPVIFLCWPGKW